MLLEVVLLEVVLLEVVLLEVVLLEVVLVDRRPARGRDSDELEHRCRRCRRAADARPLTSSLVDVVLADSRRFHGL